MSKRLNWRFEYKYRISRVTAETLEKILCRAGFTPDPHALEQGYPVSSVYFDSPGLDDYFDKAGGFIKRKKIRARIYSDWQSKNMETVKLEVKWRKDLRIAKEHAHISAAEWELIRQGRYREFLSLPRKSAEEASVLKGIIGQLIRDSMRPLILVRYARRPLVLNRQETVRLNFDYELNTCQKSDFWYTPFVVPVLPRAEAIFEIKFNHIIPPFLNDIISGFNLTRVSFSKYLESVDSVKRFNPIPR